ncbi:Vacuolar calcium ion transporter [Colletotrichum orbiculare MAFF 240422]|uniref:Vacuolar calcium ion transporter n=1 Tax=Colletotrichum orbiculare (strain 104-T / ATCC 96160 / CBS 514.97 / LARS 414 / MAFF 240422) TaxID=1213857 RepID=A0A484G152_COLOR|nr:Vacuolar calcium ion transporter [Colletotrichum orbiculare MAFF 240422]
MPQFLRTRVQEGLQRLLRICFPASPSTVDTTQTLGLRAYRSDADSVQDDYSPLEKDFCSRSSFAKTMKFVNKMLLGSWLNVLLVFVPVGLWAFLSHAKPILVFVLNGIAIIPLSALLTGATEKIASEAGDTIGAFLNISLGNLVELILFMSVHNQIHVVQASILGSMLVNLLLILGTALCVSGLSSQDPTLNTIETQLLSCLLFVSVFVFLIPAAFHHTFNGTEGADGAILKMSRASAFMVLFIYVIYFVHELRTHSVDHSYQTTAPNISLRTIRFADETLLTSAGDLGDTADHNKIDGAAPGPEPDSNTRQDQRGRKDQNLRHEGGRASSYGPSSRSRSRSLSRSMNSRRGRLSRTSSSASTDRRRLVRSGLASLQALRINRADAEVNQSENTMTQPSFWRRLLPIMTLIISSGLMSMCAEFLVGTIDAVTHQGHLSESVIGLIILPIVGNVAEYVTVVTVAAREKLDLAIAVAIGSSIQIALCVAPLTVIAGWILSRDLSLDFNMFEIAALTGTALLVNLLILSDGSSILRTSGLKGALMCACYIIIGFGAYLSPETGN